MKKALKQKNEKGWGGAWTEKKLNAFIEYVKAYLTILNNYPKYKTIYFDGFAGSGERGAPNNHGLFQALLIEQYEESVYAGAAERLISLDDPFNFDFYYFIEKNPDDLQKLEERLKKLPNSTKRTMVFRSSDCNEQLLELAKALNKNSLAALIFLDPFGMQINWESIESLKGTHSDIWILLPTGVIVNRLLDRKADLLDTYSNKLESFFGLPIHEIKEKFYVKTTQNSLFEDQITQVSKVSKPIEKIAELYIENLKKIWRNVTPRPLVLKNSNGTPIFHFVFASNNAAAIKIAKHIVEKR